MLYPYTYGVMLAPSSQIAGVRRGAQHAVSWNRSPSTTDNCLKFMFQIGQLFWVLFLLKKLFAKKRLLLIWNFFWTLNKPMATMQESSLSHGSTSSIFLNESGISSLTALPAPCPNPSSRVKGRFSAWQTQPGQKQKAKEKPLPKKGHFLLRNALSCFLSLV